MVITGTTMNFKLAPIFDRLMAYFETTNIYLSFIWGMRFLTSFWLNGGGEEGCLEMDTRSELYSLEF